MAKQLNVNLAFTADTSKAKAQLQSLQKELDSIMHLPTYTFGADMQDKLKTATNAAAELKIHLEQATNVKTGTLDFSKLNQSLKNSKTSLVDYAKQLSAIGPEGQKAFQMLTQAVMSAEIPIRRSNAMITELWTTMKNTARWQLTSSMLHGFIGAVQTAVGYTQDLNESLNNIRIVSGASVEEMAEFAKEANKTAKALNTSTTKYTNAALIYYQQGLDTKEVKERTDITVKMANVSRQSSEVVSDQMTAIWNNFDNGTVSLEHYADAMAKLGAETASSSDEIAQGLEKFAATADMIGLSFDNAAAALATVTATTRQSADVVGTAFKTIFARIQGLKLGETLEDGTTLNKYSQALESVGISIKDYNGELKNMDTILEEMGTVWKTLEKDQQAALAQTVAGTRQYNQLVSLMENFDFYQQNITSAQMADGTLDQQAEIYAESWEAARDRVKAATEGLYDSIIDDKSFITVLKVIEKTIGGVEKFVDSIGGMGGVIFTLGSVFTRVFRTQITSTINDAAINLLTWTEKGRQKLQDDRANELQKIQEELANQTAKGDIVGQTRNEVLLEQIKAQLELAANAKNLTEEELRRKQILLDQLKIQGDIAIKTAEEAEKAKARKAESLSDLEFDMRLADGENYNDEKATDLRNQFEQAAQAHAVAIRNKSNNIDGAGEEEAKTAAELTKAMNQLIAKYPELALKIKAARIAIEADTLAQLNLKDAKDAAKAATDKDTQSTEKHTQAEQQNTTATNQETAATQQGIAAEQQHQQELEETNEVLKKNTLSIQERARNITNASNAVMAGFSAFNSLSSAIDNLKSDGDFLKKLPTLMMSIGMAGGQARRGLESLGNVSLSSGKNLAQAANSTKLMTKMLHGGKAAAAGAAKSLLALGIYAAIAVAAIVAITAAVKEIIDVYKDDAKAVKEHKKTVQDATEAYENAKQAVDDLKSSLEEYDKFDDAFEKLTQGTKEWNEALTESNALVMEMIRKYPELAKYLKNDAGRLTFTDTEAVEQIYNNKMVQSQSFLNTATIAQNLAENRYARTQALRDKDIADTYNGLDFTTDFITYSSLSQGNAITGLTAAITNNSEAAKESEKALNQLQSAYSEQGSLVFTSYQDFTGALDGINQKTIDALWKNKEALENLSIETNANTEQMRALLEGNADNALQNDDYYKSLNQQDQSLIGKIMAKRASSVLEDQDSIAYKKARRKAEQAIFNGALGADDYTEYLKARYGDDWTKYKVVNAPGNDATLKVQNDDGSYTTVGDKNGLSNTAVLDFMTSYYAQQLDTQDKIDFEELQGFEWALKENSTVFNDKEDENKILQIQQDLVDGKGTSIASFSEEEKNILEGLLENGSLNLNEQYLADLEAAVKAWKKERPTYLKEQEIAVKLLIKEEDRYHRINLQLEHQELILGRISKERELMYGKGYLDNLEAESKYLEGQIPLLEEKARQQKEWLKFDTEQLKKQLTDQGHNVELDANGHIANLPELMNAVTSDEQKTALENYEATIKRTEEMWEELFDAKAKVASNNYDKLTYALELEIEALELENKHIELTTKKLADGFGNATGELGSLFDQRTNHVSAFTNYENAGADLQAAYDAKKISTADYVNGLREIESGLYAEIQAIQQLDEQAKNYYGETLAKGNEELQKNVDKISHGTKVLEHYTDLMDVLGKSKDYDAMGNFLTGRASTIKDRLDVEKANYDVLAAQKEHIEKELDTADGERAEILKKQLEDVTKATMEAEDKMLSSTKEWAEAMKDVIENNMSKISSALENAFTNGLGFENLMDSYDKLNTRQEEYLTKTNQIYETNKLMRTANKALDETDNKVAKQKLKNFVEETKGLQQNTQLSQYELDLQQAKYDLLLAEISLEEAQNAKSVVRLRRDSEGNMGYVYTADENKVSDAEQNVEDKENALYNKSLEGQQKYTQKYLQAQQEMFEELQELNEKRMSGEIATEEEYKQRLTQIQEHYYGENGVLTTYANLAQIAVSASAAAAQDNWQAEYLAMTQNTDEWKTAVNGYLGEMEDEIDAWEQVYETANENVSGALDSSKDATDKVTEASKTLKNTLVGEDGQGGLVKDLGETYTKVHELN